MADRWDGKPQRRRWPWVVLTLTLLILVPVLWYWGATVSAKRQLMRRIDELRAAGEPMYPSDLNGPEIPDEDNAAIELKEAVRLLKLDSKEWNELDHPVRAVAIPLTAKELASIQVIIDDNAEPRRLVAEATKKPRADWQIRFQTPMITVLLPHLNNQRALAILLQRAGMAAHQQQNDRQAVEHVQQILFMSRALDRQPIFVSHLVAIGTSAIGCALIEQVLPDLRIGPDPDAAEPRQVKALIADLLDDQPLRQGLRNALRGERVMQVDAALAIAQGKMSPGTLSVAGGSDPRELMIRLRRQTLYADALFMVEQTTGRIEAMETSNSWPVYQKTLIGRSDDQRPDSWSHPLASMLLSSFRSATTQYRAMTEHRLAAAALAIRWYAVDHSDQLPAKLEDLVPTYLPAVPKDPMAEGASLRYLPDRHLIYSVGENGKDDGGSESVSGRHGKPTRWNTLDAVLHLDSQPRDVPIEQQPSDTTEPGNLDAP